jgi:hypothetical protein
MHDLQFLLWGINIFFPGVQVLKSSAVGKDLVFTFGDHMWAWASPQNSIKLWADGHAEISQQKVQSRLRKNWDEGVKEAEKEVQTSGSVVKELLQESDDEE